MRRTIAVPRAFAGLASALGSVPAPSGALRRKLSPSAGGEALRRWGDGTQVASQVAVGRR